jgi:glutaredoxin
MKFFVRTFFKTLRVLLGPAMLLKEALTRPKGMVRSRAGQDSVDQSCRALALYQYKTCPFCIKVRQEMRRLSLNITHIDAQPEGPARAALTVQGGHTKVPCLKITDETGSSRWLYDSDKIIAYLRSQFAHVA